MAKIILAGGSGHLGRLLTQEFVRQGAEVIILSRRQRPPQPQVRYMLWDGQHQGAWVQELNAADVVINLSGETIQRRFTPQNKKLLELSRFQPTMALAEAMQQLTLPPRLWINFSGVSLFNNIPGLHTEESMIFAEDFLARLTRRWEQLFFAGALPQTQRVALRLSPVLSADSGMFKELYPLAKVGLGGPVGQGHHYMSWIHQYDLIALVCWIIAHPQPQQVYHACSPFPETNRDFMAALRNAANCRFGLPLPIALAKIGAWFKSVDDSLLLDSVRVGTAATIAQGFTFQYPKVGLAFQDLIHNKNTTNLYKPI